MLGDVTRTPDTLTSDKGNKINEYEYSGGTGVRFNVDARALSRYVQVQVSPTTTQTVTALASLSKGESAAVDATSAGVKALVEV
jgi:hypothetical protein